MYLQYINYKPFIYTAMKVLKCLPAAFLLVITLLLLAYTAPAQTVKELKQSDKIFGGPWVNKKTSRHLRIFLELKEGFFLINDWNSKEQERISGDAYKAFLRSGKLVMPAETEHRAPYSEMIVTGKQLIYITKYKGVDGKAFIEKETFVREPW
jgi:hypothetical protein